MQQKNIEKQLAISEQKFQVICLISSEVIFELNENITFSYISDNCYETFGREKQEIPKKTLFDFLAAEETAVLKSQIEKSITDMKKPDGKTVHFLSFKDGRRIKKTVCPLFRNGLLAGFIAQLTKVKEK